MKAELPYIHNYYYYCHFWHFSVFHLNSDISRFFVLDVTFLFMDIFWQELAEREIFWCSLMLCPWIKIPWLGYMVDQVGVLNQGTWPSFLVSSQWLKKTLVVHLSKSFLCTWLDFFCSLWWFLYLINWTIRFFFIKKIKKCSSALFWDRTFRCVSWPVLLKIQVEIVT